MVAIFVTRERTYRKLLAFSLMEILIVVAIIAILSSVIVYRSRNMNFNQKFMQCKANILEIAAALEAYKVSNGFYTPLNSKAGTIGSPSNGNSYRIIAKAGTDELLDFDEYKFIPELYCPLGGRRDTASSGKKMVFHYGLRLRQEEYTIICFKHSSTACEYRHLKDRAPEWVNPNFGDGSLQLETTATKYSNDSW